METELAYVEQRHSNARAQWEEQQSVSLKSLVDQTQARLAEVEAQLRQRDKETSKVTEGLHQQLQDSIEVEGGRGGGEGRNILV